MIVLPEEGLAPLERHGLEVLIDLARLLPAPSGLGALRVELVDGGAPGVQRLAEEPEIRGDALVLDRALLATIGRVVSAEAEQATPHRDTLGRVPSRANALVAEGRSGTPVLSQFALRLRRAAARASEGRPFRTVAPWPNKKRWAASITHDLDVVALWPLFTGLRLQELAGKGEWGQVWHTLRAALGALGGTPVYDAVQEILDIESAHGLRSSWYILCGTPTWSTFKRGDLTYRPESAATRRILAAIAKEGCEIGLHGSLETAKTPERFQEQRARLTGLAPTTGAGVRQHFLRMDPGPTQRGMLRAGFQYDATFGFADRNEFRLGVADVVPWFDVAGDELTPLEIVPFCWMDRTQSKYQGIEDPKAWVASAIERVDRCREVEGFWSGIWHPNLTDALGYPRAPESFRALCEELAGDGNAWVAPVGEVVAWRRRRRTASAMGLGAAGEVNARAGIAGEVIRLEDASGALREEIRA